jgi:hypothetical protein
MFHEEKGHASSSADSARRLRSAHALFCDSKPRVSQISCRRFLCECRDSILSLSANVSVPLIGTSLVFTPEISGWRFIPHSIFFLLCSISDLSPSRRTQPCRGALHIRAQKSVYRRVPIRDRGANGGTSAHQLLAINRLEVMVPRGSTKPKSSAIQPSAD